MLYALVFYPELRHPGVDALRARYDPTAQVVRDHVTFVFPLPGAVGRQAVSDHVRAVASRSRPFRLHLLGLEKSWDQWLLLAAREGREEAIRLHDALHTGILAPYLRRDLPYAPHVGLGCFATEPYDPLDPTEAPLDEEAYDRALGEAEALGLDFWRVVEQLTLVEVDEGIRRVRDLEVIPLGHVARDASPGPGQ